MLKHTLSTEALRNSSLARFGVLLQPSVFCWRTFVRETLQISEIIGLVSQEPKWEEKKNIGDNRLSIVDISVCVMEPEHKQIAELKSNLEESRSSCNFKKNKQMETKKKKSQWIFWLSDHKSFQRGDKANIASRRPAGAWRHWTSSDFARMFVSFRWRLSARRRHDGTSGRAAADVATAVPVSAAVASKMLYRFTGNSGRNLLMDSQTAVAQGRRGGGRGGRKWKWGWMACSAGQHANCTLRTSGEPLGNLWRSIAGFLEKLFGNVERNRNKIE